MNLLPMNNVRQEILQIFQTMEGKALGELFQLDYDIPVQKTAWKIKMKLPKKFL